MLFRSAGAKVLSGEALYRERTCIACHGADARTPILPDYPKLAGQNAAYLLRQAQDLPRKLQQVQEELRHRTVEATVGGGMGKVVGNTGRLSKQDRAAMAGYIKSLPAVEGPKQPEKK